MSNPGATDNRLLIVDDDMPLARMLAWAFEDLGYRVLTANDCRTARRIARLAPPTHALIDYRLPDGDGHSLANALSAAQPELQVILMSADRGTARREITGMTESRPFFEKPVRPANLHRLFTRGGIPATRLR
jgi:DNA-binding response OmpR family regulator